jgi:LPXTG-motif cell wall-anchored protein
MLPTDSGVHVQPTPQPSSHSTPPPVAQASTGSSNSFILFIVGAVLVGIVAVLLFFREKSLTKVLNE